MPNYNKIPKIGWSAATVMFSFATVPLDDVLAFSWSDEREVEEMFGTGSEAIGYGVGKRKCEASITTYLEQVLAIISASPQGKLTSIPPFDFIMQFIAEGSPLVQTVTCKNCKIKSHKASLKNGDLMVETEMPMVCSDIIFS